MTHLGPLVAELAARRPEPRALVPAAPPAAPPREVAALIGALGQRLGGRCPALLHDRADDGAPTHRMWTEAAVGWLAEGATLDDLRDVVRRAEGPRAGEAPLPARVELADVRGWVMGARRHRLADAEQAETWRRLDERSRAPSEAAAASRDAYRAAAWARAHDVVDGRTGPALVTMLLPGATPEVWAALRRALGDETARRVWALLGHARRLRRQTDDLAREVASLREELRVVRGARDPIATAEARARLDEAMERAHREGGRITRAADAEAARIARDGA